jgi:NmrA-like family
VILITGATGNNGGEIIAALVTLGRTDVRALVRSPDKEAAKVAALRTQGVEVVGRDLAKLGGEAPRDRGADSAAASGDQGPLAGQGRCRCHGATSVLSDLLSVGSACAEFVGRCGGVACVSMTVSFDRSTVAWWHHRSVARFGGCSVGATAG